MTEIDDRELPEWLYREAEKHRRQQRLRNWRRFCAVIIVVWLAAAIVAATLWSGA